MSLRVQDRLILDDGPAPAPRPAPQPAVVVPVTPSRSWFTATNLKHFAPWVAMGLMAGVLTWQVWKGRPAPGPTPHPTPTVDATKDGAAWAKELPLTFADSFAQAQADVRGTEKSLDAIRKEHVERWKSARDSTFNKRFVPLLDQVIPPGNDKPSMEDRRRYAEVMGQIVTGVREAAK